MSEEYDVFGELEALCSDKFNPSTPPLESSLQDSKSDDDDDDVAWKDDFSNTKKTNEACGTKSDSTLENFNNIIEKERGKAKQKKRGKTCLSTEKDTSSPPDGYGFSTTLGKRSTPEKDPSQAKRISRATRDLSPLLTVEEPSTVRRQTRSMNKAETSMEEQLTGTTNALPAAVPLEAAIDSVIEPQQTGRGRKGNRGRKKQTQQTVENQVPVQTSVQNIVQAQVPSRNRSRRNHIQQMYSARESAALMAAQSTNVSYVDLVSSPVPRIEGVICVDSDSEEKTENIKDSKKTNAESVVKGNSLDLSFDEENPEISVKIIWNGNPEVFNLRKYQKFGNIFSKIAEREGTDEKNLVFNINNTILSANDTPASINYKIYQFINGRVLVSKFNSCGGNEKKKRDPNKISLKIQSDQFKRPMQVELLKTEKFKILYIKCAEELKIPYENLKLSFDGELLEFDDTPADVELEGGEAIDLRIKK